jgi:hypothetical protein
LAALLRGGSIDARACALAAQWRRLYEEADELAKLQI